ncbi:ABC transporter ATP-binding protein [Liquorilactobacillus cacaonum]|uniref:ABC transporter ATP-binding protein n=1 Tax=Liquorilactobacillus cacaonum DSM 21116 TaxID=1423729 RepID=A0A0R2CTY7_9LACO|nr:ABC transporter ATP-binding protein [Liquorilactobacillus cacaonum]KRM91107.1 ABC transporter ATP-binding protein [Liquorilactobacillus cacaonum DSM 21116]
MVEPLISFRDFSFKYDSQAEDTLKDINLDIYPGEKVLIAGASGSGKSTLGRVINGLIPHAFPGVIKGSCIVNGKDVATSSLFDLSFDVGTVLQDPDSQFVGLTVAEDMAFSLENDKIPQSQMKEAVAKWANTLSLNDLLKSSPQEISGGQKQRVAMAGVLIDDSKILLFDEPLASLDPAAGLKSMELIDDLASKQNLTVIIIEHRIEEVLHADIDRLIVLRDGKIVADDTPTAILVTEKISQLGLREPLYLGALRHVGVSITDCQDIQHVETIKSPVIDEKLKQWTKNVELSNSVKESTDLLILKNIGFSYDNGKQVINNLNLTIHRGEMVSLVGRNGTGKSTLSNLITGFLTPTTGEMLFENEDMSRLSVKERASKIGYILQDPNQMISKTTVFEEVSSGLVLRAVKNDTIQESVYDILKVCGLYEMRNWPISALSFGQKKRVTIAAILVLNPEMLILDEPTAGQDYEHYTEIMSFLEGLLKQRELTIVLITHDMHLMLEYTTRTIVLGEGHIIMDDEPAAVLTNDDILKRASLAKTSLYTLADRFGLPSADDFVAKFIESERRSR